MRSLVIDNGSKLIRELAAAVPGEVTMAAWEEVASIQPSSFDLIVLSGGSLFSIVGNEERLKDEIRMIRRDKKPLIGICFGCELIAEAFGGTLERMASDHQGEVQITVAPAYRDALGQDVLLSYEHHEWRIKDVPEGFVVMASSDHGPELIRHKELPIFGLQFHPEKAIDQAAGGAILKKILSLALSERP